MNWLKKAWHSIGEAFSDAAMLDYLYVTLDHDRARDAIEAEHNKAWREKLWNAKPGDYVVVPSPVLHPGAYEPINKAPTEQEVFEAKRKERAALWKKAPAWAVPAKNRSLAVRTAYRETLDRIEWNSPTFRIAVLMLNTKKSHYYKQDGRWVKLIYREHKPVPHNRPKPGHEDWNSLARYRSEKPQ